MYKLPVLFLLAIFSLASCNNNQQKTDEIKITSKVESDKLNDFLKKFEEPPQTFQVATNKRILIECNQGTNILIDPFDLETESGGPVGKNIDIEVKELFTQQQFVKTGIQTVSDGRLLVSGGALYINLTSDGQKLKLKEGKTYSVQLPKISEEEMNLFYGQFDSTKNMNWKQTEQVFVAPVRIVSDSAIHDANALPFEVIVVTGSGKFRDTVKKSVKNLTESELKQYDQEMEVSKKVYSPINVNKFGWINCDRFNTPGVPLTNVEFTITNKPEEVNYILVYMIFTEINSVMQCCYYSWNNKVEKNNFYNTPIGTQVKFLAMGSQHGKIFATLTNKTKLISNHNEKLTLQEMSEADFHSLMKNL